MSAKKAIRDILTAALCVSSAFAQAVSSNLIGTVVDPASAAIAGVEVTIKDQSTGAQRTAASSAEGLFRFNTLPPGVYNLSIKATGFKAYSQQSINLASSETRDLGRIQMTLGSGVEEVTVTAVAATQEAASEKSALVDGKQLNQIALRGRDLFGYLRLLPGVTGAGNNETTTTGLSGR